MNKLEIHSSTQNTNFIRLHVIKGKPSLQIDNEGLSFNNNKAVYLQLNNATFLKVLVDKQNKFILVKKANSEDSHSFLYDGHFHFHAPKLFKLLSKWMDMKNNNNSFKINGVFYPSLNGILFDAKDYSSIN